MLFTQQVTPNMTDFIVKKLPYDLSSHAGLAFISCRIPDDCIDEKRYPLFMARAVLQELIESLQPTTGSAKP